jgi:cellulose synthase/poly-beta-1,6-N-acetylglucosamine synthase-like glycosyltransferase
VNVFLSLEYPAELQVILAYNTPETLPVEEELRQLAAEHPNLQLLRVPESSSKAQNVNSALRETRGRFVGVFDADHHPQKDSFLRAWRWLSNGYAVVQGHCMIRNGEDSTLARLLAVEFEAMYAVSHPGRSRLHHFAIFGGSNGFWRTDVLHKIRMRSSMLTEDIDSSIRLLMSGDRIVSDPGLVSTELAPTTLSQLWNQRMRWAQGWFQVSIKHLWRALSSSRFSGWQRLGIAQLLFWREVYPWISLQIIPLIAFWAWKAGGLGALDWMIPVFVMTTLFTLSVGPGQSLLAYLLGHPSVKRRRIWFVAYFFFASVFYSEFKNTISRVAQIRQFLGEQEWIVTPRRAGQDVPPPEAAQQLTTRG